MNEHKPQSILVVDDDVDTCANLQDILSDLGYEVDVAHNGPEALQRVEQRPYDIALLDLRMPGMDGVELYRRIKQLRAGTVAIIVSAYASSDASSAALAAGAWQVLSKPVDFERLFSLIGAALDQPLTMIVDDDMDLCAALWDLLRDRGYRVCLAHSPQEAALQLAGHRFSVVLIDMRLQSGSGAEVFREVRTASPATRTILITGHRDEQQRAIDQILNEGADAVCFKPFDVATLLATLQSLADRR